MKKIFSQPHNHFLIISWGQGQNVCLYIYMCVHTHTDAYVCDTSTCVGLYFTKVRAQPQWYLLFVAAVFNLILKVKVLACVWLCNSMARQAPLSMGFSRQEYWSGLPCPPPGHLPNPGTEPSSPTLQQILYHLNHQGRQLSYICWQFFHIACSFPSFFLRLFYSCVTVLLYGLTIT